MFLFVCLLRAAKTKEKRKILKKQKIKTFQVNLHRHFTQTRNLLKSVRIFFMEFRKFRFSIYFCSALVLQQFFYAIIDLVINFGTI